MQARFFPWLDRSGRLSALKLAVFAALFAPAVWIAVQYDMGWLKSDTVKSLIHASGLWAIRILLVSLAVTPLRRLGQWTKLIAVRRMLGVAVLFYVLGHFALYIVQQRFDLAHVASEIVLRLYLTIGFVALLGLAVLGATSTDAMIRRVGAARWNRLHLLVYPIAILALVHFMLQTKLDVSQPLLLVGLFVLEMGWRLLQRFKRGDDVVALSALVVAAPLVTAASRRPGTTCATASTSRPSCRPTCRSTTASGRSGSCSWWAAAGSPCVWRARSGRVGPRRRTA